VPEEKLLRLIKGAEKQPTPPQGPDRAGGSLRTARHENGFWQAVKDRVMPLLRASTLRGVGVLLFVSACAYLGLAWFYPVQGLLRQETASAVSQDVQPYHEVGSMVDELSVVERRNIFGTPARDAEDVPVPKVAGVDSVRDIGLVAILSGDNPQAALEDKSSQKVYYVTPGQFIGDIQVEAIKEGKVLLNDKGTRYELFL
jgi:hypothetical protein